MVRFTTALAVLADSSPARERIAARVAASVGRGSADTARTTALVEQTMQELPLVLASTRQGAELSMSIALPLLQRLGARIDAELPNRPYALADAMLERTYLGLRVLAVVPRALSAHEFHGLFALHDILGPVVTARLDGEIARAFPGITLAPMTTMAVQVQADADSFA